MKYHLQKFEIFFGWNKKKKYIFTEKYAAQ